MMSEGTNNYYSSFEPVTVYINGEYFGLYELREKFNTEYFNIHDNAKSDSLELLSLSYFYNLVLRAVEGDVDNFYNSYDEFLSINTLNPEYFNLADKLFDLKHYSDYIIAESFMGNVDWPGNNIKIYRSDKTNYRWRFCLIDLELSMQPNGWTSCVDNHIRYMLDQNPQNPYINIWLKSIKNNQYLSYFINRYADLLNTSYQTDTLLKFENRFYNSMVDEMPNEFQRWGDPNNIAGQMQTFNENHNIFRSQLACRGEEVRQDLLNEFDLQKQIDLELDIFPANSGSVKLNTIEPQIYPWSGIYFDGVAVKMEANAKPGYEFSHWKPNAFIV
ncbi:MAG: CotH kinase family protein, partial [Crocinitomicaceae bacterium]